MRKILLILVILMISANVPAGYEKSDDKGADRDRIQYLYEHCKEVCDCFHKGELQVIKKCKKKCTRRYKQDIALLLKHDKSFTIDLSQ